MMEGLREDSPLTSFAKHTFCVCVCVCVCVHATRQNALFHSHQHPPLCPMPLHLAPLLIVSVCVKPRRRIIIQRKHLPRSQMRNVRCIQLPAKGCLRVACVCVCVCVCVSVCICVPVSVCLCLCLRLLLMVENSNRPIPITHKWNTLPRTHKLIEEVHALLGHQIPQCSQRSERVAKCFVHCRKQRSHLRASIQNCWGVSWCVCASVSVGLCISVHACCHGPMTHVPLPLSLPSPPPSFRARARLPFPSPLSSSVAPCPAARRQTRACLAASHPPAPPRHSSLQARPTLGCTPAVHSTQDGYTISSLGMRHRTHTHTHQQTNTRARALVR